MSQNIIDKIVITDGNPTWEDVFLDRNISPIATPNRGTSSNPIITVTPPGLANDSSQLEYNLFNADHTADGRPASQSAIGRKTPELGTSLVNDSTNYRTHYTEEIVTKKTTTIKQEIIVPEVKPASSSSRVLTNSNASHTQIIQPETRPVGQSYS